MDTDVDLNPFFVSDLQNPTKKNNFLCSFLFEGTFTSFFKDEGHCEDYSAE
jgi:hypothetical protein